MNRDNIIELKDRLKKMQLRLLIMIAVLFLIAVFPIKDLIRNSLNLHDCDFGYYQGACVGSWLELIFITIYLIPVIYSYKTFKLFNKYRVLKKTSTV